MSPVDVHPLLRKAIFRLSQLLHLILAHLRFKMTRIAAKIEGIVAVLNPLNPFKRAKRARFE